jgi:hypothetical protein
VGVISAISSRNSVPRSASSKHPARRSNAVDRHVGHRGARAQLVDRERDELLARAALARDEHRRARGARLLDHLVDLPHLRAVADHPAEAAALAQLAPERLHLAQRLLPLHDLREQDLQPLRIDRLGHVVVGADLDGLDGGLDSALAGEDDGGDVAVLLLQRAQQVEAVHAGHREVADDDARAEARDLAQRLLAVGGRVGHESPRAYELGEADTGGGLVLDDEQSLADALCGLVQIGFGNRVHGIVAAGNATRAGEHAARDDDR